jgi:hypothetical protein
LLQASAIHAQDLGHKLPGGIGLDAGKAPPEPGFYLVDRFVTYDADQVRDRRGDVVPVKGLRIGVLANGFGVAWAFELPRLATRASVTVAAPLVDVRLNSDAPEASVERFGLADVFIQPLKLGLAQGAIRSGHVVWTVRPDRNVAAGRRPRREQRPGDA